MHARCWPYVDDCKNQLMLGSEVALMLVFMATAVLRSALAKQDLVDAKLIKKEDLTDEDREMPKALSAFMVLVSVLIQLTILLYNKCKKTEAEAEGERPEQKEQGEEDNDTTANPMFLEDPVTEDGRRR